MNFKRHIITLTLAALLLLAAIACQQEQGPSEQAAPEGGEGAQFTEVELIKGPVSPDGLQGNLRHAGPGRR